MEDDFVSLSVDTIVYIVVLLPILWVGLSKAWDHWCNREDRQ